MRDRIILKEPVNVPVPGGGFDTTYVNILEEWTHVRNSSQARTMPDNQIVIQNTLRFKIRYRDAPQPNKSMLVEFEGNDYSINEIPQIDLRKRYWDIVAVTNGTPAPEYTT